MHFLSPSAGDLGQAQDKGLCKLKGSTSELPGFANMSSIAVIQPNTLIYNSSAPSKGNTGSNNHAPVKAVSPQADMRNV